jgi:hypothetical protein
MMHENYFTFMTFNRKTLLQIKSFMLVLLINYNNIYFKNKTKMVQSEHTTCLGQKLDWMPINVCLDGIDDVQLSIFTKIIETTSWCGNIDFFN